jgi:hypothetical protein
MIFVKCHNFTDSAFKCGVVGAYLLGDVVLTWAAKVAIINNTSIDDCKCLAEWIITWNVNFWTVIICWVFTWEAIIAVLFKTAIAFSHFKHILILFFTLWHWRRSYLLWYDLAYTT